MLNVFGDPLKKVLETGEMLNMLNVLNVLNVKFSQKQPNI